MQQHFANLFHKWLLVEGSLLNMIVIVFHTYIIDLFKSYKNANILIDLSILIWYIGGFVAKDEKLSEFCPQWRLRKFIKFDLIALQII